jgi:carboxypeptidase D
MMEVGPWRIDGKGGFKVIEGGWEEYTTMVYGECWGSNMSVWRSNLLHVVDQPAGTGFSYVSTDSYVHSLAEVEAFHVSFCPL